jgi:hypothetical protein
MLHLIFDSWIASLFRLIGVCVLFTLGYLKQIIRPGAKAYSFRNIYYMEYDKEDEFTKGMERAGQQMTGLIFVLVLLAIYALM